jgi:L,D-transpeptidase catalytic domain
MMIMKLHTHFDNPIFRKKEPITLWIVGIMALFLLVLSIILFQLPYFKPILKQNTTIISKQDSMPPIDSSLIFVVPHDVKMKYFFTFMDSVRKVFDTVPYNLNEHILVRHNPFIIDTLENTDYYRMKLRDTFIYDQKQLTILKKGDTLRIPTQTMVDTLNAKIAATYLDINIPEFKLRIIEDNDTIYTFPVRVGQNRIRYLAEAGRDVDLKTHTGVGYIAFIHKKDFYFDPVSGKKFTSTKRDDNKRTLMPLQPWLEPKINGELWGQLIHPTTNPETLFKAYSNGCIGAREADIWRIYYHAPVGTKVVIRYDLIVRNEQGDTVRLRDIYLPKYRQVE